MSVSLLSPQTSSLLRNRRVELIGLGTAVPPLESSQERTLDFILKNFDVADSTRALYRRALSHPSIKKRQFGMSRLDDVLERDHDAVNARFERWAVELSTRALNEALGAAGLEASALDYVAAATCTGYLCPGLSAYLIESCGLRRNVRSADVVGMGCGAALPALEQAANFALANPGANVAVVCTEICSAAMYADDTPDTVISNAIFSDGSAAVILRAATEANGESGGASPRLLAFESLIVPEWRETLRFRTRGGRLRNILGKDVPAQAAEATEAVADALLARVGKERSDIRHWIVHAGGEKVLSAVEQRLNLSGAALGAARAVLEKHGNMSSPTVLFVLDEHARARRPRPGELGIVCSFGAGFSAHGALVEF